MILQALKEYYDRMPELPRYGFEEKELPYVLALDRTGKLVALEPTYEGTDKGRRAKRFLVPASVKRASGIAANLLWDNPEYALGVVLKDKKRSVNKTADDVGERVREQHSVFKQRIADLKVPEDEGLEAVRRFLEVTDKAKLLSAFGSLWESLLKEGANISFKLAGDSCLIVNRPAVRAALEVELSKSPDAKAVCLITGEHEPTERLHAAIKGVWGAQTSGANIVSFNLDAFKSFGKDRGANAPVSKTAAFAYSTALNHLLGRESFQRMQVGDASTVFWAERATDFESQVVDFFGEPRKDDPDRNVRAVESLFRSVKSGAFVTDDARNKFYVLGLAPNASRIAIRFWIVDTVKGMSEKVCQHFKDTEIVRPMYQMDRWPQWQSLNALLAATARETKYDKNKPNLITCRGKHYDVNPNLEGDSMRAILEGLPYPQTLLQAAIRRIRAEHEIAYPRAALIKAFLNRSIRFNNPSQQEEMKVSLDPNNTNIGYRLGRLFAALEKIQIEAHGTRKLSSTIRDRYYGAASSTPVSVFGTLMNRLTPHHLEKLGEWRKVYFKKLLSQIADGIDGKIAFPPYLPLEDQGRFAIGYYHQMQKLFEKKTE